MFDWTDVLAIGHEIIFGRRAAVGQFFNVLFLYLEKKENMLNAAELCFV